jgi:hypothetical protein
MAKHYKKLLALIIIPLLVILSGGVQVSAFDLFNRSCDGNQVQGGNNKESPVCTSNNGSRKDNGYNNVVLDTINDAINIITLIAGAAAVIMILVAGFTYITAGGNAEDTKNARSRIIYAAVGMAVIAFAWTITRFITDKIL